MDTKKQEKVFSSRNVDQQYIFFSKKGCLIGILFFLFYSAFCSSENGIVRILKPSNKLETQILGKSGIVRSLVCDITVEAISKEQLGKIKKFPPFKDPKKNKESNIKNFLFFMIIIKNTTDEILIPNKFEIATEKKFFLSYDLTDLNSKNEFVNSTINMVEIIKPRKMIREKSSFDNIELSEDTVGYDFNFILPDDSLIYFKFFPIPPIEERSLKLKIEFNSKYGKKIVDFDILRDEYRSDDKKNRIDKKNSEEDF